MLCDLSQSVEKDSCTRVAVDVKERVSSRLFRAREAVTVAASVRSSVKCCMTGSASQQWIVRNLMCMSWRCSCTCRNYLNACESPVISINIHEFVVDEIPGFI